MKVMLSDFTGADRVYIVCGYTDLRRGIDGLAALVQQEFQLDPFSNCLFLFCGRRGIGSRHCTGGQRFRAALQASGIRQLPVAAKGKRGKKPDAAAIPLAHGGLER